MLLAMDTATRQISIALHDGQAILAEQSWHSDNRHTAELAPAVERMFALCEVKPSQLTALATSIGPGSYTGLRIGVALAKGLAAAQNLPLVGMNALDILARGQSHHPGNSALVAVVQAGRGRIITGTYRWGNHLWQSTSEPRLTTWEGLITSLTGPVLITGEINAEGEAALRAAITKEIPITIAPSASRLRRASFLADYAWEQLRSAGEDRAMFHPTKLMPIYIQEEAT